MLRGVTRRSVPRAGQVTFTESMTWRTPHGVKRIQVFCVGGGASGITGKPQSADYESTGKGAGGGSGYTTTGYINVNVPTNCTVTIGAGGVATSTLRSKGAGSPSSLTTSDGSQSIVANGGTTTGRNVRKYNKETYVWTESSPTEMCGTNGGSGGGVGLVHYAYGNHGPTAGASNGGEAAGISVYHASGSGADYVYYYDGGYGQGYTTKAFGEDSGTLFATGGTGAIEGDGTPNTGNGGNGAGRGMYIPGGTGGSGIVIARWSVGGR